jgi:hypothetical protein
MNNTTQLSFRTFGLNIFLSKNKEWEQIDDAQKYMPIAGNFGIWWYNGGHIDL